ncbi:MAG: glycosyltransferase [Crocinitomicaceae bacterium]|nr:glycosyltransferase [Crocinitomicaceae bacterium]
MKKIAIVHDWLITIGGAEKVLKQLLIVYPNASLFFLINTLNEEDEKYLYLDDKTKRVSHLNKFPFVRKLYRIYVPIFYKQIEKFDFSEYDIILSSSHSVAKNIRTNPNQIHICYCHTPIRYVWNMKKTYLQQLPMVIRSLAMRQISRIKKWDYAAAQNVSSFIANSHFVAERISTNYGRSATVIHPPVNADFFHLPENLTRSKKSFLVVSRLVHYKKIDLIIDAFNAMPDLELVVIGTGPQSRDLQERAGDSIQFLGFQPSDVVRSYMQESKAIVMAAIEDFGITSLETQACGTPVIAFNYGGYKESVVVDKTGVLFQDQTSSSIIQAVREFEKKEQQFDRASIRTHAATFSNDRFQQEIKQFVEEEIQRQS